MSERRYLDDLARFEKTIVILYDWSKIWHRQAGGYTASDTEMLLMRVSKIVNEMIDHNPELECFRERQDR